ncbi:hypothetical protein U472_08270 [Orenia metallireducens]|uniref:Uncharacterized protein n=1 Tax=Orenia metallireducens TaxID=1413210 RepID=A0A1C0A733_9FIRM|nr:hypothetical protein U472_08270 [Orenia metallireducens]
MYVLNNPLKYTDPDGHDYLGIGEALDDLAEKGELPWDRTARELTFMDYMKGLNEVKHFFDSDTDRLLNHYRQSDEYFEWQLTSKEANYLRSIKLAKTGVEVAGFVELGAAAYGEYKASKSVAKLDNLASEARFFDELGKWSAEYNYNKYYPRAVGGDIHPAYTRFTEAVKRHKGMITGDQRAIFPSQRAAKQATSEIAGDLGSETIRWNMNRYDIKNLDLNWQTRDAISNSKRIYARWNKDMTVGWRHDIFGHVFPDVMLIHHILM